MKNIKRLNWLIIAIMLLVVISPINVMAQDTSSAIAGTVSDSDGNPVIGATVVVKHIPTGAVKTLETNNKGNYQARGLRVGGPYSVTISSSGYGELMEENIYIQLGQIRDLDAVIQSDSVALDAIHVVGIAQSAIFNADSMGSGTTIDGEMLDNLPTITRNIQDFLKTDSRINIKDFGEGISVSGVNNRYNNFSIDGVNAKDPFGLEDNGFSGLGQGFNIDTIEALNLQLSPYDVTLSNFTGANINAVTKSGTNEFTGSLNVQYGNENFVRSDDDFKNEIFSLTFGGPIIKDKLFFFLGYEDTSTSNLPNSINATDESLQQVADIARNVYGIDPGTFQVSESLNTKENLLLKFDWQINENHRAAFRYTTKEDSGSVLQDFGGSRASFSSHWYNNNYQSDSFALNVYSDWTPNFTTEVRISTSEFDKVPTGVNNLPQIRINNVDGFNRIYLGREDSRHANALNVVDDTFYFEGNYFIGNHTIKAGVDIQKHDIYNLFVFNAFGAYQYNSIQDFADGIISDYDLSVGSDLNNRFPAANWAWTGKGLFLQDNWMVNEKLTIQYGLRWDKPSVDGKPTLNQGFADFYGFDNNSVIDSGVLQPRFGFNYDMSTDLKMQLRGGIGIFSGGAPNVWLSNPFTNPGGSIISYNEDDYDDLVFNPDGPNQPIPDGGFPAVNIDLLEPGFKLPTVLKTNIAFDTELPWYGLEASFEYEYTKQRDGVFYQHLNLGDPEGTLPDGRNSYYGNPLELGGGSRTNRNRDFGRVYLLTNSGNGYIKRATISLSKRTEHFFAKASYTNTSTSEVSNNSSSIANSNWENRPSYNPNDAEVGVSAYEIANAFNFVFNYNNNFFGDTITNIGLIWTSRDSEPVSYNFDNDINGDGVRDNDLFYVPNVGEYVLSSNNDFVDYDAQVAAFESFLESSGLSSYRGQVAPRYAFNAPRVNLWDLKIKQELPSFGFGRVSLFFSIKNLGNLINKDWGQVRLGSFDGVNIAGLDGFDSEGRWLIDWNGRDKDGNFFTSSNASQWQAQVGVRFDW